MWKILLIIADLIVICTTKVDSTRSLGVIGIILLALSLYLSGKNGG